MKCTVLGAGAWGTTFGQVMADAGNDVTMWPSSPKSWRHPRPAPQCRSSAVRRQAARQHDRHGRPGAGRQGRRYHRRRHRRPVRARGARRVQGPDSRYRRRRQPDEGIERNTKKRMDEVVREALDLPAERFAAVSGPNLSKEIADRQPAATVVACENLDNARKVRPPARPVTSRRSSLPT